MARNRGNDSITGDTTEGAAATAATPRRKAAASATTDAGATSAVKAPAEAAAKTAAQSGRADNSAAAGAGLGQASQVKPAATSAAEAPARRSAAETSAKAAADAPATGTAKPAAAKRASAARSRPAAGRAPDRSDTRTPTRSIAKPARPAAETQAKDQVAKPAPLAASDATKDSAPADPMAAMETALTNPRLPERLAENIERIETLGQRLIRAMAAKPMHSPAIEGPGPELYGSVAQGWLKLATEQPARIIEQQVKFWGDTLRHLAQAQGAFAQSLAAPEDDQTGDKRFKNPLWQTNPFYNYIKRQYLINAEAMRTAAADLKIEDEVDRRRIDWFTRQMIDMLSPTNFLATNPDALEKAIETEGESLVRGLENLVSDIEAGGGELVVSLADRNAFHVGENIGTTPGDVVYRTPLFELIQFKPSTEQVHATPVVVFPPWINKYYIMDLKPQNSLLRWIVEQGHTLFVVSWKNPDASFANVAMDDYVAAYLDVFAKALELTGEKQLNAVGYCIAGTTLSATLALMQQRGDDRVKSATFFTTLTDFSDQGEFTTFLQDDFVGGIEQEVAQTGYLSAQLMQRTFSFLRANDLVWGPAIRSYMLGEPPPAFDLLYWNGDGTNLPGRMVTQYLRELCQANALAAKGFDVLGGTAHLSDIKIPICAVACEGDHIAPWVDSWKGVAQMGSEDKTFIMSESGHIAGIINPPGRIKYGHYTSDAGFAGTASEWREAAEYHQGSWWGRWGEWLAERAGRKIPAREVAHSLGAAPGTYVHEKA